jgi:[acyl-carrier-protein] S-malonyltransferase
VERLDNAVEAASNAGGTCRRLDVSAAFHSPVMAPAAGPLKAALDETSFSAPSFEFWSSTTAGPVRAPEEIRKALLDQLTSPVRWRETVEGLAERIGNVFCDLGPGRVVAGLTKRLVKGATINTFQDFLVVPAGGAA